MISNVKYVCDKEKKCRSWACPVSPERMPWQGWFIKFAGYCESPTLAILDHGCDSSWECAVPWCRRLCLHGISGFIGSIPTILSGRDGNRHGCECFWWRWTALGIPDRKTSPSKWGMCTQSITSCVGGWDLKSQGTWTQAAFPLPFTSCRQCHITMWVYSFHSLFPICFSLQKYNQL